MTATFTNPRCWLSRGRVAEYAPCFRKRHEEVVEHAGKGGYSQRTTRTIELVMPKAGLGTSEVGVETRERPRRALALGLISRRLEPSAASLEQFSLRPEQFRVGHDAT